jgi:hypothetical protein
MVGSKTTSGPESKRFDGPLRLSSRGMRGLRPGSRTTVAHFECPSCVFPHAETADCFGIDPDNMTRAEIFADTCEREKNPHGAQELETRSSLGRGSRESRFGYFQLRCFLREITSFHYLVSNLH